MAAKKPLVLNSNGVIEQLQGATDYLDVITPFYTPPYTTAERDALTPVEGMMIYNSTTKQVEKYEDTVWSAGAKTLPDGGSPEYFLKRTSTGYVWAIASTETWSLGGLTTTGNIKNAADDSYHVFGAGDDYTMRWDGTDAVHTITSGAYNFDGGPTKVASMNTTQRDALTANNGMFIYNTTANITQFHSNGAWRDVAAEITAPIDLYITTTGNDTTGDGSAGSPWASIDRAMEVVNTWILRAQVTIYIEKGDYTSATDDFTFEHPDGAYLTVFGDAEFENLVIASSTDGGTYRTYTFNTSNPGYYTVGQQVVSTVVSGGTNTAYAVGTMEVIAKTSSTVTLRHDEYSAAAASGVTCTIIVPQVFWARQLNIATSLQRLNGIHNTRTLAGHDYFLYINGVDALNATFTNCVFYNDGTKGYGYCINRRNSFVTYSSCGFKYLYVGTFAYQSSVAFYSSGFTGCTYGMRLYIGSHALLSRHHCVGATNTGFYFQYSSGSGVDAANQGIWNNSTPSSPTNGIQGNQNSWMQY